MLLYGHKSRLPAGVGRATDTMKWGNSRTTVIVEHWTIEKMELKSLLVYDMKKLK
jgi:hypothetical protein